MKRKGGFVLLAWVLAALMLCGCAKTEGAGRESSEAGSSVPGEESSEAGNSVPGEESGKAGSPVPGEESSEGKSSPEEEPAPEPVVFEGVDMNGNKVTSDLFADSRLTMINVWATYCGPCLREMPDLGELAGEYDSADFQLYGIISDVLEKNDETQQEKAAGLIEETGANYPHLLLNDSLYNALLTEVTVVPTTFFIDENGVVIGTALGARKKSEWKEIIDGLLEEL